MTTSKSKSASSRQPAADRAAKLIAAARKAAFTDENPKAAFDHFRPLAERVPTDNLPIFTGQPLVMRANAVAAIKVIEPHLPKAVELLPRASLKELFELPSLVMALDFAANRVPVAKLSSGEIQAMLDEGAPWREVMLRYLEVVSHPVLGLLPENRVRAIRQGTGKLDKARDFVAIAGMFAEYEAALAGKHPFDKAQLDRLATLGGALVQQLVPGTAPAPVAKRTAEAILRDQFAALVEDRYDHLQVLATVALGKRRADALVPALRTIARSSGPASPEEPPAGEPSDTAPSE